MRILVTGGAGFIGSHVVDAYVAAGHEVIVADDLSTGRPENVNVKAEFHRIELNSPHLGELFHDRTVEVISHHAAQVDVRRSVADPLADAAVNISATIRLLELCRHRQVQGVIFSSSGGAVYGEQPIVPTPEDAPPRPLSPYGIAKLAGERYVDYYRTVHGIRGIVLRYANVYGPRQDPHGEAGVVAIFCDRLLRGESPTVFGDGGQTRDFVYVTDIVTANLRVLDFLQRPGGEDSGPIVLNIGTGAETSVNALLRHLADLTGRASAARHLPPRPGEQRRSAVDPARARTVLGWMPAIPLVEGLRRTLVWFADGLKQ